MILFRFCVHIPFNPITYGISRFAHQRGWVSSHSLKLGLHYLIELKFGSGNNRQKTITTAKFGYINYYSHRDMTLLTYPPKAGNESSCSNVSRHGNRV